MGFDDDVQSTAHLVQERLEHASEPTHLAHAGDLGEEVVERELSPAQSLDRSLVDLLGIGRQALIDATERLRAVARALDGNSTDEDIALAMANSPT